MEIEQEFRAMFRELQSVGDPYDYPNAAWSVIEKTMNRVQSRLESLEKDAARYRWIRQQHWSDKGMCVVQKAENVRLGSFCPSGELLDAHIDTAMKG